MTSYQCMVYTVTASLFYTVAPFTGHYRSFVEWELSLRDQNMTLCFNSNTTVVEIVVHALFNAVSSVGNIFAVLFNILALNR